MVEDIVQEKKGNLTDYINCNCRRDGGMSGGKSPEVVYQAPQNIKPGKIVGDAPAVTTIQQFLNKEGVNGQKPKEAVKEDGRWGTGTSTAFYRRMIEIQEKNGINPNGQYNKDTADAMRKNGMGKEADALDKMKNEGTLDRVYNHRLAKVICDGTKAVPNATQSIDNVTQSIDNKTQSIGNITQSIDNVQKGDATPVIKLTIAEEARTVDAVKKIQGAMGMTQNGKIDIEVAGMLSSRIKDAQNKAGLPPTGEYDPKTAETMRQNPKTRDLASGIDQMTKVYEGAKERAGQPKADLDTQGRMTAKSDPRIVTPPTGTQEATTQKAGLQRLDQGDGRGTMMRLDQGAGPVTSIKTDFVSAGGIKGAEPLKPSFIKADANPGPLALDQKHDFSQDIFIATNPTLKQQNPGL